MAKNDEKWLANYEALKEYIDEHHHLPDKHKVENRGLLNFSKYTRKKIKEGTLDEEKRVMFEELLATRSAEHTRGRRLSPSSPTSASSAQRLKGESF